MQRITLAYTSDRSYTASWQGKVIARYELLKTKSEARLKSLYLGAKSMAEAQTIAKTVTKLFQVQVDVRPAQRCSTAFEVVVRGIKVAVMAAIEKFVLALITTAEMPAATPVVKPAQPIGSNVLHLPLLNRPDQPGRTLVSSGGLRLNIR